MSLILARSLSLLVKPKPPIIIDHSLAPIACRTLLPNP